LKYPQAIDREFSFSFSSVWAALGVAGPIAFAIVNARYREAAWLEVWGPVVGWVWLISIPIAIVWGVRRFASERSLQSLLEISCGLVALAVLTLYVLHGEWP
jgi:hypothetical protein